MYEQQLSAHYREIALRLRPPPRRVILPRHIQAPPPRRFEAYGTREHHVLPINVPGLKMAHKVIAAFFLLSDIDRSCVLGMTRVHPYVQYRHVLQTLIRDHTKLSFPVIARCLAAQGCGTMRDHTSVLNAVRRGREIVERDPKWRALYDAVSLAAQKTGPRYTLCVSP